MLVLICVDDLKTVSTTELRAAVAALERLRGVPLPESTPKLDDGQRLAEYAELLEPLRLTIGATGPWSEPPSADRFVGRSKKITQLRAFVDLIDLEPPRSRCSGGLPAPATRCCAVSATRRCPASATSSRWAASASRR